MGGDARSYVPTDLVADYDVIVVSVQYRLGYLGFLGTGDAVPGNNGIRDTVMGIKWVKDNIRAFGGDNNDVTVIGESAGSVIVSFLSLSPYGNGLFTMAIMQSGTALSPGDFSRKRAVDAFYQFADSMGCLP